MADLEGRLLSAQQAADQQLAGQRSEHMSRIQDLSLDYGRELNDMFKAAEKGFGEDLAALVFSTQQMWLALQAKHAQADADSHTAFRALERKRAMATESLKESKAVLEERYKALQADHYALKSQLLDQQARLGDQHWTLDRAGSDDAPQSETPPRSTIQSSSRGVKSADQELWWQNEELQLRLDQVSRAF